MAGVEIKEIGVDTKERDHLHLVIEIPPKYCESRIIGRLKAQSASLLRKRYSWLKKVYWKENIVWSTGFFSSTVGVNEQVIKNYVKFQGKKDSGEFKLSLLDEA